MAEIRRYGGDRDLEIVASTNFDGLSGPYTVRSLPAPRQCDLEIVASTNFDGLSRPYTVRSLPEPRPYGLDFDRRGGGGKVTGGGSKAIAWCFSDPEMKRRKRVASYKAYSVEGKIKGKFRRGWKWVKEKCHELVHGY